MWYTGGMKYEGSVTMSKGKNQKFKLYRLAQIMLEWTDDEDHFSLNVDVHVSRQFLGWVFSLGEMVKILGPEEVVREMREETSRLLRQYGTE